MSRLGAYVQASTANPLGHRPHSFALQSPESRNPVLSGLAAYYPANYYVPTPLNIQMVPQANVFAGLTGPAVLGDFSDFISQNAVLLGGLAVVGVLWYVMREPRRGRRR